MADQFRKVEQYSPKSSPRGARSPVVSRQDSTGTLKTTISLGKNPSIVHSGPFYLMKEPPGKPFEWGASTAICIFLCFSYLISNSWGRYVIWFIIMIVLYRGMTKYV